MDPVYDELTPSQLDLVLYEETTGRLYPEAQEIRARLVKRMRRGVYGTSEAYWRYTWPYKFEQTLWRGHMARALREYEREIGPLDLMPNPENGGGRDEALFELGVWMEKVERMALERGEYEYLVEVA